MPQRLIDIFDLESTPAAERFKKLSACGYQGGELQAAELYKIFQNSSAIPDDEGLARAMESPSHVNPATRLFTDIAFSEAIKRGISVQRVSLTTSEKIHEFGREKIRVHNERNPTKPRQYMGYVVGLCGVFRNAQSTDGRRLFGVFSTPEPTIQAHADIFVVIKPDPAEKLAIQRVFHDAFNMSRLVAP
jgi:hypothetical protein